jgi:RimJ/RimL family protein N-acetyltransferase
MDDRVTLRPVLEADLALVERLTSEPSATGPHQWLGWLDPGRFRRRWAEDMLLGVDGGALMVVRGTDRLGFVSWRKVQTGQTAFCWNVGIVMAPETRGHGYGTEAQRLLARYLFSHTLVNRIEAETEASNIAEQRALEKAGFTREGVLRGYGFRAGRWRDGVLYSILRDEVDLSDESVNEFGTPHSA